MAEGLSAVLYLRAAVRVARGAPDGLAALRAATVPGVALWFSFVVGLELLLAFKVVDWGKFLLLIVGALVTLLIAERQLAAPPAGGARR